jgi:hypothetical protein
MNYTNLLNLILVTLFVALIYVGLLLVPFSWWVNLVYIDYQDMQCGESVQTVISERYPLWPMPGTYQAQLVRYEENGSIVETVYTRQGTFGYEGPGTVTYEIEWSQPIKNPGTYGVSTFVDIRPLPFISAIKYERPDDFLFNVTCK